MTIRYTRMNHTNGIRGPILKPHQSVGQKPDCRRGTSDSCLRSCSVSTTVKLSLCFGQQRIDLVGEEREIDLACIRQRPDDEHLTFHELAQPSTHDLPEASLGAIAHDGIAHGLGYDETHARSVGIIGNSQAVCHQVLGTHTDPGSEDSSELLAAADPVCFSEHAQAEISERPLRRRAARIERPARVRIRRRKPCFLARLRLLGWNVRLLTSVSDF